MQLLFGNHNIDTIDIIDIWREEDGDNDNSGKLGISRTIYGQLKNIYVEDNRSMEDILEQLKEHGLFFIYKNRIFNGEQIYGSEYLPEENKIIAYAYITSTETATIENCTPDDHINFVRLLNIAKSYISPDTPRKDRMPKPPVLRGP